MSAQELLRIHKRGLGHLANLLLFTLYLEERGLYDDFIEWMISQGVRRVKSALRGHASEDDILTYWAEAGEELRRIIQELGGETGGGERDEEGM